MAAGLALMLTQAYPLGYMILGFGGGIIFASSRLFSSIMGREADEVEEKELMRKIFRR